MPLEPIRRQSVSDAVFEQLRDRIVRGEYAPGASLPGERVLTALLRVNRGAVREALKRLAEARLVAIQHGEGTTVSDFRATAGMGLLESLLFAPDATINTKTARSIIEMRSLLAPDIARLAALRAREKTTSDLRSIVERMRKADGELASLQRLGIEFWEALVDGSDNIAYRLALNTLHETYRKLADVLANVLKAELLDVGSYAGIAEAVARADSLEAQRRASKLVSKGAADMLGLLDALDEMKNHERGEVHR